jgi:hypothetical protein
MNKLQKIILKMFITGMLGFLASGIIIIIDYYTEVNLLYPIEALLIISCILLCLSAILSAVLPIKKKP